MGTDSENFIYRCHMLFWNRNYGDGIQQRCGYGKSVWTVVQNICGAETRWPYFCGIVLFYRTGIGSFFGFQSCSGKKVTNEPTPIQVQMRLYEQDVNQTFLLGASRKGEELDVDGNSRDQ